MFSKFFFFFLPFSPGLCRPLQGYEACAAETSLWSCCGTVYVLSNNHSAGHVCRVVQWTVCVAVMDNITAQCKVCVPAGEAILTGTVGGDHVSRSGGILTC